MASRADNIVQTKVVRNRIIGLAPVDEDTFQKNDKNKAGGASSQRVRALSLRIEVSEHSCE